MLEIIADSVLEELNYSGSLHIKHIRVCPTYKDEVIEFLLKNKKIFLSDDGTIVYPSPYYQ